MRLRPSALGAAAATTAVLMLAPAAPTATAHDRGWPSTYLIDPSGAADPDVYPEGIAVRGDDFFVGSTTDGTIYRGDLDRKRAKPFLLGGADGRTFAVGMKVSGHRLFIAGGPTGRVFAYDIRSRELVGSWEVSDPTDPDNPTFLNDIAIGEYGGVYVTDSFRPVLYRIDPGDQQTSGVEPLPVFLDFTGTALEYIPGFNVNGIAVSESGRYLILANSGRQQLFRVDIWTRTVAAVDLGGEFVAGDGLVLDGRVLYAIERQDQVGYVVKIKLDRSLLSGTLVSRTSDPSFDDPTTAALVGKSLLVVNSQFGERGGVGVLDPFTVSRVRAP